MNSVKIIVKDGYGCEINPYARTVELFDGTSGFDSYSNPDHENFERHVKSYPSPGIPNGTHECEKVMQQKDWSCEDWQDCEIDGYYPIVKTGYTTRIIYRLSPLKEQGERSGVKTARKFLADNLHIDESDVELRQLRAMKQYGEQIAFQVRDECSKATDIVIMINISQFIK